jgi:hypothetical protein
MDHFHARFSGIAIVPPLVVPRRFSEQVEREQVTDGRGKQQLAAGANRSDWQ